MKVLRYAFLLAALGVSANAADSLSDAIRDGKVSGELRFYYFNQEIDGANADILNLAAYLNYTTDSFYGFKSALTFQSADSPFADEDAKSMFGAKNGYYGSGAVLSEAYISYMLSKSELKVGRQFITMPLVKSGRAKSIWQSFEGATLTSNEIDGNVFYAAYIAKFQMQTDGRGGAPNFEKLSGDYGYALGIVNNYFEKLELTGAYGGIEDTFSVVFAQANFKNSISNFNYQIGTQFFHTDYKNSALESSNYYGVKLGAGFEDFNMYLALAQTKDGNSQFGVAGGGNIYTPFVNAYGAGTLGSKSKWYAIDANYNFKSLKLLTGLRYVHMDYEDTDDETGYTDVYAVMPLGGFLLDVSYENENHKNKKDGNLCTVKVSYRF